MTDDTDRPDTLEAILGALTEEDDRFRAELAERRDETEDDAERLYYQMLIAGGIPWTAIIREHMVTAEFTDDADSTVYQDAVASVLGASEQAISYMLSGCLVRALPTGVALRLADRFIDNLRTTMHQNIAEMGAVIRAEDDDNDLPSNLH